jgi:hypothetical protein
MVSSAHHFSSFNNQWYRKSIEYMQSRVGRSLRNGAADVTTRRPHSGLMDTPIEQIVHRPCPGGLGCMMCHSIAKVKAP